MQAMLMWTYAPYTGPDVIDSPLTLYDDFSVVKKKKSSYNCAPADTEVTDHSCQVAFLSFTLLRNYWSVFLNYEFNPAVSTTEFSGILSLSPLKKRLLSI